MQDPVLFFLHCLLEDHWALQAAQGLSGLQKLGQLEVTISEVSHFLGSGPCPSGVNTAKPGMASYYREVYWQGSILVSEAGSSAIRFQEVVGA